MYVLIVVRPPTPDDAARRRCVSIFTVAAGNDSGNAHGPMYSYVVSAACNRCAHTPQQLGSSGGFRGAAAESRAVEYQ